MAGRLHFEDEADAENSATIWASQSGELGITISEQMAMDSYNQTFKCTFYLTRDQAMQIRALIDAHF